MRTDGDCGWIGGLVGLFVGCAIIISVVWMVRYELNYGSRVVPNYEALVEQFPTGVEVVLKSGGPTMTVESVTDDGQLECVYFDPAGDYRTTYIKAELVVVAE